MQPNMGNSNVNHRLSVPGIPSEYDDVFLSSGENRSGANSMTNVLALSEDAHAPIARMDSAMDEDVVTQPGSTGRNKKFIIILPRGEIRGGGGVD